MYRADSRMAHLHLYVSAWPYYDEYDVNNQA